MRSILALCAASGAVSLEVPCFTSEELADSYKRQGQDIRDDALFERVFEAFSVEGPGILCVTGGGIVDRVKQIREEVLPRMMALTALPEEDRQLLVDPESPLNNGLSRDGAKSNFFFHPVASNPARLLPKSVTPDPDFHGKNLWPLSVDMPNFEKDVKNAAQFVLHIGEKLATLIDKALDDSVMNYVLGSLTNAVKSGSHSNHKARLVRYHPFEDNSKLQGAEGMWSAAQIDTGLLTGIIPGIFLDADGNRTTSPDDEAGLYVMDQLGSTQKVTLPKGVDEAIFYRIGESLQIISGGELVASPHYVKAPKKADPGGVSRCSLTVVMQPHLHDELLIPAESTYEAVGATSEWKSLLVRFQKIKKNPYSSLSTGTPLTYGEYVRIPWSLPPVEGYSKQDEDDDDDDLDDLLEKEDKAAGRRNEL